jgi:hypothetical protein
LALLFLRLVDAVCWVIPQCGRAAGFSGRNEANRLRRDASNTLYIIAIVALIASLHAAEQFRSFIGGSIMDEEWGDIWLDPSLMRSHFHFCIACFILFRAIITVLQNWPELTRWFHHRRHAKWLREAWRGY